MTNFLAALASLTSEQRSAVSERLIPLIGSRACDWFSSLPPVTDASRKLVSHGVSLLLHSPPTKAGAHLIEWEKKPAYSAGLRLFGRIGKLYADACISRKGDVAGLDKYVGGAAGGEERALVTMLECITRAVMLHLSGDRLAEAAALAATFARFATGEKAFENAHWQAEAARIFQAAGGALSAAIMRRTLSPEAERAPKVLSEDELLRKEWVAQKARYGVTSMAMDKLMDMAAIGSLKRRMLRVVDGYYFDKAQGSDPRKAGFNLRFEGNPGTGKTTATALYADLLADLGITGTAPPVAPAPAAPPATAVAAAAVLMAPQPAAPKRYIETSGAELAQGGAVELWRATRTRWISSCA